MRSPSRGVQKLGGMIICARPMALHPSGGSLSLFHVFFAQSNLTVRFCKTPPASFSRDRSGRGLTEAHGGYSAAK